MLKKILCFPDNLFIPRKYLNAVISYLAFSAKYYIV